MSLQPPDPRCADDAIRLVPLGPRHAAGIEALLQDEGVIRYTRVPSEPPPGYRSDFARSLLAKRADLPRAPRGARDHRQRSVNETRGIDLRDEGTFDRAGLWRPHLSPDWGRDWVMGRPGPTRPAKPS